MLIGEWKKIKKLPKMEDSPQLLAMVRPYPFQQDQTPELRVLARPLDWGVKERIVAWCAIKPYEEPTIS